MARSIHRTLARGAAFWALALALSLGAHRALVAGLKRATRGDYGVWNAVFSGRATGDIVALGSSRALVHVDCPLIREKFGRTCWNLGLNGSPANLQLPLLDVLLAHAAAPRTFVVTVDIGSFQVRTSPYNPAQYLPYLDDDRLYRPLVALDPVFARYRHIPLYGFATFGVQTSELAVRAWLGRESTETRFFGFAPSDLAWDGTFEQFIAQYPDGREFAIEAEGVRALDALVARASGTGARVVLVYPPEYTAAHRIANNRDVIFAQFREIAERHHAPFVDFTDHPLSRDRSLFYNSQHLNRRGARLFSEALIAQLDALPR